MVENLNANHAVLLLDKRKHLVIHKDFRPMGFCVDNVGESEAERIDRAIRHFHRSDNRRIDRRSMRLANSGSMISALMPASWHDLTNVA